MCRRLLAIASAILPACAAPGDSPPATVREVAAIPLHEDPAAPLGGFANMIARDDSGRLYVGDMTARTIQVFAPEGTHLGSMGRPGDGPGEFASVAGFALLDHDSVLAAPDPGRGVVIEFSTATGTLAKELPFPPGHIAAPGWSVNGPTALIPVVGDPAPFLRWDRATDAVAPFGDTPGEWAGSPGLAMQHGVPGIVRDAEGWLAAFPLVSGLVRLDAEGHRVATIAIPALRRMGEPAGAAAKAIAEARAGTRRGPTLIASYLLGLHRSRSGDLWLVHLDPVLERTSGGIRATSQAYFLTVVRSDRSAACIDAPVPIATGSIARPSFRGDTLWLLGTGSADDSTLVLHGYLPDLATCHWTPLQAMASVDR